MSDVSQRYSKMKIDDRLAERRVLFFLEHNALKEFASLIGV